MIVRFNQIFPAIATQVERPNTRTQKRPKAGLEETADLITTEMSVQSSREEHADPIAQEIRQVDVRNEEFPGPKVGLAMIFARRPDKQYVDGQRMAPEPWFEKEH